MNGLLPLLAAGGEGHAFPLQDRRETSLAVGFNLVSTYREATEAGAPAVTHTHASICLLGMDLQRNPFVQAKQQPRSQHFALLDPRAQRFEPLTTSPLPVIVNAMQNRNKFLLSKGGGAQELLRRMLASLNVHEGSTMVKFKGRKCGCAWPERS